MAKSITVGKRENEKKRLAKREEKQKKKALMQLLLTGIVRVKV